MSYANENRAQGKLPIIPLCKGKRAEYIDRQSLHSAMLLLRIVTLSFIIIKLERFH